MSFVGKVEIFHFTISIDGLYFYFWVAAETPASKVFGSRCIVIKLQAIIINAEPSEILMGYVQNIECLQQCFWFPLIKHVNDYFVREFFVHSNCLIL